MLIFKQLRNFNAVLDFAWNNSYHTFEIFRGFLIKNNSNECGSLRKILVIAYGEFFVFVMVISEYLFDLGFEGLFSWTTVP